ncbi:MAG: hypothetical protein H6841_11370 [Planctomycetes bacterium]|nr:hypothetical protein [Planctomycetota bacterium]MCB9935345.1 hypothetical protein [Planctomycetota bacterium]
MALLATVSIVMLASWEVYLRSLDAGEPVTRAAELAAERAHRPAVGDKRRVFVLGSSRAYRGISPKNVLEQLGPSWDVRHVAVPLGNGPAQLHAGIDLFRDGDVAVVECLPVATYTGLRNDHQSELEQRLKGTGATPLEREIWGWLRGHLVFRRSPSTPSSQLRNVMRDALDLGAAPGTGGPHPKPTVMHPDGWQEYTGDFDISLTVDQVKYLRDTSSRNAPNAFTDVLRRLRQDVRLLGARGVQVVFLRMPSDGEYAAEEEKLFPRAEYWNRLQGEFPGHCWHFADFEATRNLPTYDYTHLTSKSAQAYSRWLGLKLRGFVEDDSR